MIYFDNASSTRPNKEALDLFVKASMDDFSNPNSIHRLGMKNYNEINRIKEKMLKSLKLDSTYEIIFTSGATESNNLAIRGYCLKNKNRGNKIITTNIEHKSVLNVFKYLETQGFNVVYLSCKEDGTLDLDQLKNEIDKNTILVSIMGVNNEVGTILDVPSVSKIVKNFPKCVLHSDCAQTCGKANFDYKNCDMITISAHKIYGIKGIGLLVKKKKIALEPIVYGGNQENGLRSGTMDYPAIESFYVSLDTILKNQNKYLAQVKKVHDYLLNELSKIDEVILHNYKNSSPYILNFSLKTKKASVVIEALSNHEIYASSTSACNSKGEAPSYVLLNLGKSMDEAKNAIRLSFSKDNTIEECDEFIKIFKEIINEIRS